MGYGPISREQLRQEAGVKEEAVRGYGAADQSFCTQGGKEK